MRRFFIEIDDIKGSTVSLRDDEAHHLKTVLRLSTGTSVELFDGLGSIYLATIQTTTPTVTLEILSRETAQPVMPELHVAQGVLQGKKMDFLVQKASELGVSRITPFHSQHTTLRNPSEKKLDRWQKIAFEASKQCRRAHPLQVMPLTALEQLISTGPESSLKLILWEHEKEKSLKKLKGLDRATSLFIIIGPEGGFSAEEIQQCKKAGFIPVSMGDRILRAETASLSVMAIVQFISGNLG